MPLFPYQIRGVFFAACRGRVILADDMGLGKTIQAIAGAELLRRRRGIERVLVVAPASVKYQWKTEIEKFCDLPAQVIDGLLPHRKQLYANPTFFSLTSYELVLKDIEDMHNMRPDLVILDEAQRIRNWATATARTIKQLKSRYAFVLTGTPLENKLEELCSADVARAADVLEPIKRGLSTLLRRDAQTQRPTLTIPLPESVTAERLARAISGFLGNLARHS